MKNADRLDLARWAAGRIKAHGGDEASVAIANVRSVEVEYRDGRVDKLTEATQNALSVDVYAAQRFSTNSTSDLRHDALDKFLAEAVAMTKYLGKDEYRKLPDPKFYDGRKNVDLKSVDPDYLEVTADRRIDLARQTEAAARKLYDRIVSCTAYCSDSSSNSVMVNSNGFEGERSSTSFDLGLTVSIDDGEGGRPMDWDWRTERFHDQLATPQELASNAVDRAKRQLGQTKLESGVYDMIVENRTATRLLGAFLGPMSGSALYRKSSYFDGKLGEQVASDKFTLVDDPFIVSGLGSRLYDSEGMATKRRVMIDKGVLKQFYIGSYYARKLGVEPTIGSRTNSVIEPGDKSLDELIAGVTKGILVTSFVGGNSSGVTGDFSYGIVGHLIENGEIVKPVNEMNISGNLLELFANLADVGNDVYKWSSWRRPSLLFKDCQFSGA